MSNRTIRTYDGTIVDLGSGQRVIYRTLTSVEILALAFDSSPVVLIPGEPGAVHAPVAAAYIYRFGTTAFVCDPVNLDVGYPLGSGAVVGTNISGLLEGEQDGLAFAGGYAVDPPMLSGTLTDLEGVDVTIFIEGANPTEGDGTIEVTLWYYKIPV